MAKKIIRLTENELIKLLKKTINENKLEKIKQSDDFMKLVDILQRHPKAAEKLSDELSESLNEDTDEYHHYDYGDSQPKEISKKEYWVRRLKGLGLGAAVGALMGIVMAGGVSADDVLQMALASAAGVGAVSDTLMRTVGRTKEKEPNATTVEESYKSKKVIRMTENELIKLIKTAVYERRNLTEGEKVKVNIPMLWMMSSKTHEPTEIKVTVREIELMGDGCNLFPQIDGRPATDIMLGSSGDTVFFSCSEKKITFYGENTPGDPWKIGISVEGRQKLISACCKPTKFTKVDQPNGSETMV